MKNAGYVALTVPSGGYAACNGLNFSPSASDAFTLEAWLKLNGMGKGISILHKDGVMDWGIDNGCLCLSFAGGVTFCSDANAPVDRLEWHHVAVTYDLSFVRFFVDGITAGCTAASVIVPPETGSWRIGSDMDGRLRSLKIYEVALNGSDILEEMFGTVTSATPVADVDFSCNPPVDHESVASTVELEGGAEMHEACPAMLLRGTAYALPTNSRALNPGGRQIDPYTVHARIYVTGISPCMALMSNGDNNLDSGIALFLMYDTQAGGYHLRALRGSDSDTRNWAVSTGLVNGGEWVSVGCTYDGEHLRLYINGNLDSEVEAGPILMPQEDGNVLIGGMLECGRPTGKNTFQGYISRMEIWKVALNPDEMKARTEEPPEIDSTGLAEAFDFTNRPVRSETSGVAVALCDNASYEELLLPAPKGFTEEVPVAVDFGVDDDWIKRTRKTVDLAEVDRRHKELLGVLADDETAMLELVLGVKLTGKQRGLLTQRRAERVGNRHVLLGVTHHQMGGDYVMLAHYQGESQVVYRCAATEVDECTMKRVELVFILIAGMVSALFGIKTKLNTKAVNYIVTEILPLASVVALMGAGTELKGAQVFQLGKDLSGLGLLKELLKMIVTLGFWALLRFLAKVVLTFLGAGWVDTIASLAATAVTFGIAYVTFVKTCLPLPRVMLREIRFNHNLNRSDNSALNIRKNYNDEVSRPEWVNGESDPVAYCKATVAVPVVKTRFRIDSILSYTVNVRAVAQQGNFLGDIPSTPVNFLLCQSGEVSLALVNQNIPGTAMGRYQVTWTWQYQDIRTGIWTLMGVSVHTVYLTDAMPHAPWAQDAGQPRQWPWSDAFDRGVLWMQNALVLQNALQQITNSLYHSGVKYAQGFYLGNQNNAWTFHLSRLLVDMQNPGDQFMECSECATALVILGNIWGGDLFPVAFWGLQHTKVNTAYIKPLGGNAVWDVHHFDYHVIASDQNSLANNAIVYDGCAAVDASGNPWAPDQARVERVPGAPNQGMQFGPPSPNVLGVPYVAQNNYSNRLFENVPTSKTNLPEQLLFPLLID